MLEHLQDITEDEAMLEGFVAEYSSPYWEGFMRNSDDERFGNLAAYQARIPCNGEDEPKFGLSRDSGPRR
jgi:hypothetical protein